MKPGRLFDSNTATVYHNGWDTGNPPWIKIYFGDEMTVSEVTIVNRLTFVGYLGNLEDTKVSILKSDSSEVECGTLTGVNTESQDVADQTYTIACQNVEGVGVLIERETSGNRWCIAEVSIFNSGIVQNSLNGYYLNKENTNFRGKHKIYIYILGIGD